MCELAPSMVELTPRERGFVKRIMLKYQQGQSHGQDLYRSLAIFSAIVLAGHLLEQFVPTFWLPLLLIYPPAIWLFSRYRRFSIFRSCVLSKVAGRLSRHEPGLLTTPGAEKEPPFTTHEINVSRLASEAGSA